MSDENWIIPIPEEKAKEISELAMANKDEVFFINSAILEGIPNFPKTFIDNKIEAVAFSTSAAGDNNEVTVCLSVFRNDNGNVDIDLVGLMLMDLSEQTTSAGYIMHGDWHTNRTMDASCANIFLNEVKTKKHNLRTAPDVLLAGHKRINSFLTDSKKQKNARYSRNFGRGK